MVKRNSVTVPAWLVRALVVTLLIPALLWAVVSRIWTQVSGIPEYIWWDWCDDVAEAARMWRTGEIQGEEEW